MSQNILAGLNTAKMFCKCFSVKHLQNILGVAACKTTRNPHAIASIKPRDAAQPQSVKRS